MCYTIILEILTTIGTVGAVVVGMIAIYYTNKNSKKEIRTHKLEEVFELIQSLSRYYGIFKELYFSIEDLQDESKENIKTISEYRKIRDQKLEVADRQKIISDLARLEILSKCYTKGLLLNKILEYEDLMYSFSDFVFNAGSLHKEIKWQNGFPTHEDYSIIIKELKSKIIEQIKNKWKIKKQQQF